MNTKITLILLFIVLISCSKVNKNDVDSTIDQNNNNLEFLINEINNPNSKNVMVISHRSDWRHFPENSLEAMESSIEMGVDMIELDVAKTKDGHLIVMHDRTLDRTTTGSGVVSDWALDSIKTLYLKNGAGVKTRYKIPTLEAALNVCKGEVLVNLDKSYEFFNEAFEVAKKTGTTRQIVIKGYNKAVNEVISDFGSKLDTIVFMPIVNLDKQPEAWQIIQDYQSKLKVKAFEIVFSQDTSKVLNKFSQIKQQGSRVWVNSLWASLNAGYDDNEAVKNTDSIYGWYVKKGVNMIQTDRPQLLLDYLRSKNLHK
ncbi:glycerophosphodiester phosphodiesterase family protein [Gaetbulibacter sp. M240]|uniref:glycerophosphodiester phosphodiesterase family protein n=1 Tax=Gaetbulibacter sp. M240 TaxID=3126511 RepID=UPI00374F5F73